MALLQLLFGLGGAVLGVASLGEESGVLALSSVEVSDCLSTSAFVCSTVLAALDGGLPWGVVRLDLQGIVPTRSMWCADLESRELVCSWR
ncbi:unnamed protein product [Microthlaspi erraticum]|uniref:Secreted protein n=1 Tax=Microthlaspi erraticum TaxID=1685480 RepID=A0A6D2L7F5_9BRAS|nr:unnamed protein product [Microthlaspi erraticum]